MGKINKIAVMTSGGDSPGMNAAIRSVVRTCAFYDKECIGVYRGYQGMIEGDFTTLTARNINNIINKGGTILKSARSDEFRTPEGRKRAFKQLKDNNIDGLVVIGGDGSFTGGVVFNKEYNFPSKFTHRYVNINTKNTVTTIRLINVYISSSFNFLICLIYIT